MGGVVTLWTRHGSIRAPVAASAGVFLKQDGAIVLDV
jgi:hypothetical protein